MNFATTFWHNNLGRKAIKKVIKIVKYVGIVIILLILLIQFFLWTSVGQTMVANQAANYLSGRLNTNVSVQKVDISFFKFIRLEEVYVEDLHNDTLFYIKNLDTEISNFRMKNDTFLFNLGSVQIDKPVYKLNQLESDSLTNLYFLIDSFTSNDTSSSNLDILINSTSVTITNAHFVWDNYNYEQEDFGIDWDHIDLKNINLDLTQFEMINDSFNAVFNHLSWIEKSGFKLDNFTGNAIFSSTRTVVENLNVVTPFSNIKIDLNYEYDSIGSYVEFIDEVYMNYDLDSSIINFKDISYFTSTLQGMDYEVMAYGKERGPVSDMKLSNIYLGYGEETVINGRVFINGLPDLESTSFTCKFKDISTNYPDLSTIKTYPFTEGKTLVIPEFIQNGKTMSFKGSFTGFYNDFVTYGTFKSKNGIVKTDLKLTQNDTGTIQYSGQIKSTDFNLGQLTKLPKMFNKLSVDMKVKGEELDFETMDLKLKGNLTKFDFMGYRYRDIDIDGVILDQTLEGIVQVADTNVNLSFEGAIDLQDEVPLYKFNAKIDHLRPKQLHLLDRDSSASLSTEVIFNFQGNSIDNVLGRAGLRNFRFYELDNTVRLDTVDFLGFTTGKDKTLSLTSDNIDLLITGEFYFEDLLQSMNYVTYKWFPSIYSQPQSKPSTVENFSLSMNARKFSGFSSIFIPQITFEDDLKIEFNFNSEQEEIDFEVESSNMAIYDQHITNLKLGAQLTQDTFNLISNSTYLKFTDSSYIENLTINAIASKDLIQSNIIWNNHEEVENSGNLNFEMNFTNPEHFNVKFNQSKFTFNDTVWNIMDSSYISKSGKEYLFNNVIVYQDDQNFNLDGLISTDPDKKLSIHVDNFDLKLLNPIFKKYDIHTQGKVNGETILEDVYGDLRFKSNSSFTDLQLNHQYIGDGHIFSEWNDTDQRFDIDVDFNYEGINTLNVLGKYYPRIKVDNLDLTLSLNQFPVKIIEPFFKDYIDDVSGTITGKSAINGTFKKPEIAGEFLLRHLETHVIYLNETLYADSQFVFIRPNLIGADAIIIEDEDHKKAQANFSLFHHNYEDLNFDLSVTSINAFRAFNTTRKDNEYFYGKVYLSPGSTIGLESGYQGVLNITANVSTGTGTLVTIPFYEEGEVATNDFIYFKQDSSILVQEVVEEEEFGLNLDMSMDLNKNAEIQLIFDEFTNDKIQAIGTGSINLKISEEEDFSIYGNYEIEEGFYLFTFAKVISKKFDIEPGGRLTWNGDPYAGQANIKAVYKVRTTLLELGVVAAYDSTELTKRVPVEVILSMTGNYMNPDLSFTFSLPPKYDEIQTLLNNLDEGERNKQVFALLILNKFMPISGGDVSSGSNVVATNSTEVLSNQLSNWLSSISNNWDMGVRYNPGDDISADEVEVALSTQLFNDRVLLETNLGISGNTNTNTASNNKSNAIVGEFTISYKINKKGNIVGKVFNRSNELNPVYVNQSPYTQGIGLAYSEPFKNSNNLGCIMSNHFKKQKNKRDCEGEYYQEQLDHHDENIAKINKKVAKSRRKLEKRRKRKAKKQKQLTATKD